MPGATTVKFGAAISFIFTGMAFLFITRMREGRAMVAQIGLPATALIIIMFVTVNTVSVLLGGQISLALLFEEQNSELPAISMPRLPIGATINFSLIATAIIFSFVEFPKARKITVWIGAVIGTIGGFALIGYAVNIPALYYEFEGASNAMAIHGAALFLISGSALILLGNDKKETTNKETVLIRTKLISLFLIISIIPIIFLGIITYILIREFEILSSFGYSFIVISAVATLAAGTFAYLVTREIIKPIYHLRNTALAISKGNLDVRAKENTTDEIGELAKTFNSMIDSIKKTAILQLETERLRRIDKDKEEFAAMISHELKTPLIPISGYAELFLDGSLGKMDEVQREKMRVIYENSIRLASLIQDILDARKIELGRLKLDIRDESIKEIIIRCIDIFRPIAEQKSVRLVDESQDIVVSCDPERILQVLNNIISNAVKFVPAQHGSISINSSIKNGQVVVSIKDNGIGIPKAKQADLFKKFYQVDKSLNRKSGGTGLGLAISRGIIESHGGEVWVESKENEGTVVYFTLPKGDNL